MTKQQIKDLVENNPYLLITKLKKFAINTKKDGGNIDHIVNRIISSIIEYHKVVKYRELKK